MARPLPRKGFYVNNLQKWAAAHCITGERLQRVLDAAKGVSVVYCSGTTKGNLYYDPEVHGDQWNHLTWTCLPSVKDAEAHYDFHEENPTMKELPQ